MSAQPFESLVSPAWLADHLHDDDLVVLDVRVVFTAAGPTAARDAYEAGHVPGAALADLPGALCDATSPMAFAMPTPQAFCAAMGRLGVSERSRVVLYDACQHLPGGAISSVWAARLWWMLRWVGFDQAALLDGGFDAWIDAGLPVREGVEQSTFRQLSPHVRPTLIADRDEVLAAIGHNEVALVDTLDADHFSGRTSMYRRPGHIAGALNRPVYDLYDSSGRFLPTARLVESFGDLGPGRIITYCGGGIAASAAAFAMTRAGLGDVAVYTASLQEWAADASNPMVTDTSANPPEGPP